MLIILYVSLGLPILYTCKKEIRQEIEKTEKVISTIVLAVLLLVWPLLLIDIVCGNNGKKEI